MVITTKFGNYDDVLAKYVRATDLVDFDVALVKKAANELKKDVKSARDAIVGAHRFVAQLPEGFDRDDTKASVILRKGRGMCTTKTTLFVALVRAMGIPVRVHAWFVKKSVHKDRFPWLVFAFTPRTTLFTYPEVYFQGKWVLLSGVLTTREKPSWDACPFDDAAHRKHPLKKEWVSQDLGVFWHPDLVFEKHGTNADGWRRLAFPFAQLLLNR